MKFSFPSQTNAQLATDTVSAMLVGTNHGSYGEIHLWLDTIEITDSLVTDDVLWAMMELGGQVEVEEDAEDGHAAGEQTE